MNILSALFLVVIIVMSIVVVVKIAAAPIQKAFKLLLNALSGFLLLLVANLISGFFDFSIGINLVSCLISGIFGIPGVAFLILLKMLFL